MNKSKLLFPRIDFDNHGAFVRCGNPDCKKLWRIQPSLIQKGQLPKQCPHCHRKMSYSRASLKVLAKLFPIYRSQTPSVS